VAYIQIRTVIPISERIGAMLLEAPQREYRLWILDSRRWRRYSPRSDDIVIATYPKCGTTWMQRIVGMLVFQTAEPMPIMQISPWIASTRLRSLGRDGPCAGR
jgi:hypothetical protein